MLREMARDWQHEFKLCVGPIERSLWIVCTPAWALAYFIVWFFV